VGDSGYRVVGRWGVGGAVDEDRDEGNQV